MSWIAGSEGFSRRGSGKGFVLLMETSVETILQISVNYLEYSGYLAGFESLDPSAGDRLLMPDQASSV
ncbi:hypothetical protein, partial [Thermostichus sp. OS-CIW-29]